MNYLQDKFDKTGLKKSYVANKLGIQSRTLNNWLNMENINTTISFLELLKICNINLEDFLEAYYKK